jgi:hypothetical protein
MGAGTILDFWPLRPRYPPPRAGTDPLLQGLNQADRQIARLHGLFFGIFLALRGGGGSHRPAGTDSCGSALAMGERDSGYSVLFRLRDSYCVWRPIYEALSRQR